MSKAVTTYCQFHCRSCGAHFTSERAFDAHRAGSHRENTRHCIDPSTVTGRDAVTELIGTCRISDGRDHPHEGVSVWMLTDSVNRQDVRETAAGG